MSNLGAATGASASVQCMTYHHWACAQLTTHSTHIYYSVARRQSSLQPFRQAALHPPISNILAEARSGAHPCSAAQVDPDQVCLISEPGSNRCQHLLPAPQEAASEPVVCTEHIRRVRMQVHTHSLPALQTDPPSPDQCEILCISHGVWLFDGVTKPRGDSFTG